MFLMMSPLRGWPACGSLTLQTCRPDGAANPALTHGRARLLPSRYFPWRVCPGLDHGSAGTSPYRRPTGRVAVALGRWRQRRRCGIFVELRPK